MSYSKEPVHFLVARIKRTIKESGEKDETYVTAMAWLIAYNRKGYQGPINIKCHARCIDKQVSVNEAMDFLRESRSYPLATARKPKENKIPK